MIITRTNILLIIILACYGCSNHRHHDNEIVLVFDKKKAVDFSEITLFKPKTMIRLEVSDNSLVYENSLLRKEGDNFRVSSNNKACPVLRFGAEGNFMHTIGDIGNGPGEYSVITDISVNTEAKRVEILSAGIIRIYTYDGIYLGYMNVDIPASSFVRGKRTY
jgi:hypothetical protein